MRSAVVLLFLIAIVTGAAVRPRADLAATNSNQSSADYMTPLMRAAAAGRVDEVRRLLQDGADVNEKIDGIGITALMLAAHRGHVEIVKVFLTAGADPNAAGGVAHAGFFTPLIIAIKSRNKNRLEVIDTLVAGGAHLNPPPPFPESPLYVAIYENDIEMIEALLKRGSDVNWEDHFGNTAFATAVTTGEPNVAVVRLLLKAGADPNKPRLLSGDDCVSLLRFLGDQRKVSRDKVTEEIRRLIIQAGGKRYVKKSRGETCEPWTK